MGNFKPSLSALTVPILFGRQIHELKATKDTPIVMVHGIFNQGNSFGPLNIRLKQHGYKVLTPDLSPNNGANGIHYLSHQLDEYIDDSIHTHQPFHLVGFSMGGIVARNYLTHCNNPERCLSLTTIAAPHRGTKLAHLYPLQVGKELRPNSTYLNQLNNNPNSYHPHTITIRTPLDGIIISSESSTLAEAQNITHNTLSHALLLMSKRVANSVLNHIKTTENSQQHIAV